MPNYSLIAKLIRYYILLATTTAGSGHVTSSLSATDLLAVLYFNYFHYDFNNPHNLNNDRLIFSKGHASPLLYALYKVAGKITTEELLQYRKKDSPLQGHPTPDTPYVDVATGSLGMGLSYGLGMSLGLQKTNSLTQSTPNSLPKIFVLLGDGELAEGQNYEALQLASHYNANNLIGILDVNRLAETGETQLGYDVETYQKRISSFSWDTYIIDGHNYDQIDQVFNSLSLKQTKPAMIIAKTIKGKGVSFLEDQLNRHGKALNQEEYAKAIEELSLVNSNLEQIFSIKQPQNHQETIIPHASSTHQSSYNFQEPTPTRKAYGLALAELAKKHSEVIALDCDLSDSTFSGLMEKTTPNQFINMFIAEQNMVSSAVGLSKAGLKPFASTFSAFMTRAYDQIRMASLSQANLVLCGSHGGVSVGEDGPSGMGLEDIAMLRPIQDSIILYPSDAISMTKIVETAYEQKTVTYIRSTRVPTPIIYPENDLFPVGGSKTLKSSTVDICAIITAGITLHEALKAYVELQKDGLNIRIIDLYSIKPLDTQTLHRAAQECQNTLITIEDHSVHGGLGDAVSEAFTYIVNDFNHSSTVQRQSILPQIYKLGITTRSHSATPAQNLDSHGLSYPHIVKLVKSLVNGQ